MLRNNEKDLLRSEALSSWQGKQNWCFDLALLLGLGSGLKLCFGLCLAVCDIFDLFKLHDNSVFFSFVLLVFTLHLNICKILTKQISWPIFIDWFNKNHSVVGWFWALKKMTSFSCYYITFYNPHDFFFLAEK